MTRLYILSVLVRRGTAVPDTFRVVLRVPKWEREWEFLHYSEMPQHTDTNKPHTHTHWLCLSLMQAHSLKPDNAQVAGQTHTSSWKDEKFVAYCTQLTLPLCLCVCMVWAPSCLFLLTNGKYIIDYVQSYGRELYLLAARMPLCTLHQMHISLFLTRYKTLHNLLAFALSTNTKHIETF